MALEILIARHGNTIKPGEPSRRVGARTDAPLVEEARASAIGRYLKAQQFVPDEVYSSPLKRTLQTAQIALKVAGLEHLTIVTDEIFREIDYGPDENRIEDEVVARLGAKAIQLWNEHAIPPPGWLVDPKQIEQSWLTFAEQLATRLPNGRVLVVTSNGVARFAPILCGEVAQFKEHYGLADLKIGTGRISLFRKEQGEPWRNLFWNLAPDT